MKLGQSLSSKLKKSLSNSIDLKCLRIWLTGLTGSSLKKQLLKVTKSRNIFSSRRFFQKTNRRNRFNHSSSTIELYRLFFGRI